MKKKNKWINKESDSLFRAILALENIKETRNFFRDLLTEEEIFEFSRRWKVAQMLSNNIPYSKIEKETGMSSTTIARVSKWLNSGMNGYKTILKRLKNNNSVNHHSPA
jgi:TrpR-related protein YerC/YecD